MVRDMLIKSISHICENCNLSLTKSVTYHNNEINSKYNIFLPKLWKTTFIIQFLMVKFHNTE